MSETHQYDKADRRSSMKIYFHGFRGLGHFPQQAKKAFLYVQMRCLPSLYRIQYNTGYTEKIVIPNSLPEPNLLRTSFQEFGITFLSLAVFPMQKCFEYH